jgi:hypothetical protein
MGRVTCTRNYIRSSTTAAPGSYTLAARAGEPMPHYGPEAGSFQMIRGGSLRTEGQTERMQGFRRL